ncbi:hypothetical protein AYO44_18175, partial [Planctomycetaceae bacterium SCGC AG-212-F19]
MPSNAVADVVGLLGQQRILDPGPLEEVKAFQARFADARALFKELINRGWMSGYQATQILSGRAAGLTLGSYVILDLLGEGGAGQVFKAKHVSMNRLVALKVLRKDLVSDQEVVARFYREIEVASHISHPNIVHAYDAGPIGSALVLAMEFVDGLNLEQLVKENGKLPVGHACDYIRQAAVGLQHAHEKGLIHRDIKPSNLLLVTKAHGAQAVGVVKILDLGLARLAHPATTSATKNLTVLAGNAVMQGTPDYMAPEQAVDFHTADTRADIYSLGCTFFYLLAGAPPFTGSLPEKLMKHQTVPPPAIEDIRKDVPPAIAEVLKKMLAKRPPDRYRVPGEVAQALAPFVPARRKSGLKPGDPQAGSSDKMAAVRAPSGTFKTPAGPRHSTVDIPGKGSGKLAAYQKSKRRRLVVMTLFGTVVLVGLFALFVSLLSSN